MADDVRNAEGEGVVIDPAAQDRATILLRLAANSAVQIAGSAAASAIAFFTFVAATRGLGPVVYGEYVAATVFLFIPVVLSDLGLSTVVLRQISAAPDRTQDVIRASLPLRTLVSLAAISIVVGLGLVLPFSDRTRIAILIGAVGAFATMIDVAILPVLQAQLRMQWAVAGNLAGRLVTLGLTVAAIEGGHGIAGVAWANTIGLCLTLGTHVLAVGRIVRLRPVIDVEYWRGLLRDSLVLGLALGLGQVYFRIDSLLLAFVRPELEVGLYGAAYKFVELAELVMYAIVLSVFPALTRFVTTRDPRTGGLLQRGFDVMLAAAAPVAVVMLTLPSELLRATAGSRYEGAATALQILAVYPVFAFVNGLFARVLVAADRDRDLLRITATVLTLNVAANVALLPRYGFEAAAAIAIVTEMIALAMLVLAVRATVGTLPNLRYALVVALAASVMAATTRFVEPAAIAGVLGAAVYGTVLIALPGTGREIAVRLARGARRPARARR